MLRNAGLMIPPKRVTINLAPADLRKKGMALICRWRQYCLPSEESPDSMQGVLVMGGTGTGWLYPGANGILPAVLSAKRGMPYLPCSGCESGGGSIVEGIRVIGLSSLEEFLAFACYGTLPAQGKTSGNAGGAIRGTRLCADQRSGRGETSCSAGGIRLS